MTSHTFDAIVMALVLVSLLSFAIFHIVQNIRDAHAARETAKRDRWHDIATIGFASAFFRGWIDEKGNVIERVGDWEDTQ